uniref:Secreted protein n=1 Tax=Magallana gigas TaxID=29159 RepID=A0A8W8JCS4_MAGGI
MGIYTYLIVVLLLTQGSICALQYCPEAVASVEVVKFCPTTEKELDRAAKRKNCDKLATSQNCSSIENFVYHCTINSYRNATLEVCAPKRTILGCSTTQSDQAKNKKDQRSSKADQDDLPTQQLLDENPTPSATSPVINPNARDDDKKKALGCNTTESNQAKNKKDQRSSKADQDDLPTQQLLDENPTPSATSPVINPNARDDDRKKALGKEEIEDTF